MLGWRDFAWAYRNVKVWSVHGPIIRNLTVPSHSWADKIISIRFSPHDICVKLQKIRQARRVIIQICQAAHSYWIVAATSSFGIGGACLGEVRGSNIKHLHDVYQRGWKLWKWPCETCATHPSWPDQQAFCIHAKAACISEMSMDKH